jgi:hypothetical protein
MSRGINKDRYFVALRQKISVRVRAAAPEQEGGSILTPATAEGRKVKETLRS